MKYVRHIGKEYVDMLHRKLGLNNL